MTDFEDKIVKDLKNAKKAKSDAKTAERMRRYRARKKEAEEPLLKEIFINAPPPAPATPGPDGRLPGVTPPRARWCVYRQLPGETEEDMWLRFASYRPPNIAAWMLLNREVVPPREVMYLDYPDLKRGDDIWAAWVAAGAPEDWDFDGYALAYDKRNGVK